MAVYFERPYRPWWSDLASATLSGLVKGMFDRDAAARAQRVNASRWGEFEKLYDEASGQYAAPQESPLTIQSAPEAKKLSQTFVPRQNAFGADPFGGVPEAFRPQEGDGLLGTTVKALQNNAARGYTPTIDDVYRWGAQSGAINDSNFQKFVEARFGSRFKMQDADRLSSRLGPVPQYNDRQGTLEHISSRALYDPDGAKTVGNFIQSLNPGFNNQTVNLGDRQVVLSQDKYTGETTPVFGGAVGVSPDTVYNNAHADYRAKLGADARASRTEASFDVRKAAGPYIRAMIKNPNMGAEDYQRMAENIRYDFGDRAGEVLEYLGNLPSLIGSGTDDDFNPTATIPNPFYANYQAGKKAAVQEKDRETLRERQIQEIVKNTGKPREEVESFLAGKKGKRTAAPIAPPPASPAAASQKVFAEPGRHAPYLDVSQEIIRQYMQDHPEHKDYDAAARALYADIQRAGLWSKFVESRRAELDGRHEDDDW